MITLNIALNLWNFHRYFNQYGMATCAESRPLSMGSSYCQKIGDKLTTHNIDLGPKRTSVRKSKLPRCLTWKSSNRLKSIENYLLPSTGKRTARFDSVLSTKRSAQPAYSSPVPFFLWKSELNSWGMWRYFRHWTQKSSTCKYKLLEEDRSKNLFASPYGLL